MPLPQRGTTSSRLTLDQVGQMSIGRPFETALRAWKAETRPKTIPFRQDLSIAATPNGKPCGRARSARGRGWWKSRSGAAAALFTAGIAARTAGKVLWCVTRSDLFAPAIEQAGLPPGRVSYVEAGDEKSVLACFEEGFRGGFGAVIAEIVRVSMTASRRLQLAAEKLRRYRHRHSPLASADGVTDFGRRALSLSFNADQQGRARLPAAASAYALALGCEISYADHFVYAADVDLGNRARARPVIDESIVM
jgi:hypothetical protein